VSDTREGRTHWEGCWDSRGHHDCAIAEIARLRSERVGEPDALTIAVEGGALLEAMADAVDVAQLRAGYAFTHFQIEKVLRDTYAALTTTSPEGGQ
jgi:hypothetical protein